MRELSVFVTGIAAFVEDYRRVLAVDAPDPVRMTVGSGRGETSDVVIPAHFPYVRVPLGHVDDVTLQQFRITQDWDVSVAPDQFPPDNAQTSHLIRQTVVRFLRYHEVVLPDSDTAPTVDLKALNATKLPTGADKTSLEWVTSMTELGTTAVRIDPRHVTANPTDVAAYVRFPKGHISTAFVTKFKFVSVNAVDAKPSGSLDQAVAQLIVCTINVPDDAFTVTCRGYNGASDFNIVFKAGVAKPWMVFACTSLEDALQLRPPMFGLDHHFRLVYKLADSTVRATDIALPKSIQPANVGPARPLGEGGCVPPRFSGGSTGGL